MVLKSLIFFYFIFKFIMNKLISSWRLCTPFRKCCVSVYNGGLFYRPLARHCLEQTWTQTDPLS